MRRGIQFNIDQLLDGEKTVQRKLPPMPEFSIKGDVELEVTLSRRGNDIFVEGKVTFVQQLECSRCSKAISSRRAEDVKAVYLPYAPLDGDLELSESDIDVLYYEGNIVDLEPPVRDAIVLSIPMRPLCDTNCKGLCPACGANLNEEKCRCALKAIDPRWKALEELFL